MCLCRGNRRSTRPARAHPAPASPHRREPVPRRARRGRPWRRARLAGPPSGRARDARAAPGRGRACPRATVGPAPRNTGRQVSADNAQRHDREIPGREHLEIGIRISIERGTLPPARLGRREPKAGYRTRPAAPIPFMRRVLRRHKCKRSNTRSRSIGTPAKSSVGWYWDALRI